jgi:hypothetical protein
VDNVFQKGELEKDYKAARDKLVTPLERQRLYLYYRWVADQISDGILNLALVSRFNVLWETTGESTAWTHREIARIRKLGYIIVLTYPLVQPDTMKWRLDQRSRDEGQEATPAEQMDSKIVSAQTNLMEFLSGKSACPISIMGDSKALSTDCSCDRVIMYNNQLKKGNQQIVFDSKHPQRHKDLLQKVVDDMVSVENLKQYLRRTSGLAQL